MAQSTHGDIGRAPGRNVVEMRDVTKRFGPLTAVNAATLTVRASEVHALVGENGAGKSTLMNMLFGVLRPDEGDIVIRGETVEIADPAAAIAHGIGMVHQHFKLAPSFTVAENIILGAEPVRAGRLDLAHAEAATREISHRYGLDLDPRAVVGDLPVGLQQRVEILKALYRDVDILILDEPTTVLTPQETEELFATMRRLAEAGRAIIFITHKLREVIEVSDRVSVMRRARIIETLDTAGATADGIATMMVGRSVLLRVDKSEARPERPVLRVSGLDVEGDRGETAVDGVSFDIRSGEIVGVAGVQGNGQDELVEAIAGLRIPRAGTVEIDGARPALGDPAAARKAGLAYIPAKRQTVGLCMETSIWENMALGHHHTEPLARGPSFSVEAARRQAGALIERFDVRGARAATPASALSGGNQQKVVLARELTRDASLVIAEQPSQGVDIGAIEFIHRLLVEGRDAGKAVFVISADLDEVFSLADRILVMFRGRIVGDMLAADADRGEIGRLMGGVVGAAPPPPTGHLPGESVLVE